MPQLSPCGASVISVDFSNQQGDSKSRASLASEALARLNERQIAATLAFETPLDAEWLDAAGGELAGHELAILATPNWYSVSNRRGQFAQEITRHVQQAQQAGYRPTSLALPGGRLAEHLDLLVKHGISAVRTTRTGTVRSRWSWGRGKRELAGAQPQTLRWGLWEFGRNLSLVDRGARTATRELSTAAAEGSLVQIVVDLPRLAGQGASGWKQLTLVLDHLAQLKRQQVIEPLTVSGVVAGLARTRLAPAAHSILRPAA